MNQMLARIGLCGLLILGQSQFAIAANKPKSDATQVDEVEAILESEAHPTNASVNRRVSLNPTSRPQADPGLLWWQAGYVQAGKQWRTFEDSVAADDYATLLEEYRAERTKLTEKPHGHWQIATWCRKRGLPDQERVHLLQVLASRDPHANADAVYERLGYQRIGYSWISPEERRATSEIAAEIERSHKQWDSRIRSIQQLLQGSPKQRALGDKQLTEIKESSAVPVIVETLCLTDQSSAELGVRTLGQISEYQASRALAGQAVSSPWKSIRTQSIELLKRRKLEEFVPDLLLLLSFPILPSHDPAALRTLLANNKPVAIPGMKTNWDSVWIEETRDSIRIGILRLIPVSSSALTGHVQSQRVLSGADLSVMTLCQLSLLADQNKYTVEKANESRADLNERICEALTTCTGRTKSLDSQEWSRWWADLSSNSAAGEKSIVIVEERQPVNVEVRLPFPDHVLFKPVDKPHPGHHSCLVAGTSVWTETGFSPIEQIRPGDRVLAKDIKTGELSYKPVLVSTERDPTPVHRIRIGNESIVASLGHNFWVSGDGWTRTRELIPQLPLHTATGMKRITSMEDEGRSEKVYNLVVADFHTYFVGQSMVLSHDVTTPALTNVKVPGLAVK